MDDDEIATESQSDTGVTPATAKRRWIRTIALLIFFVFVVVIVAGVLEIAHYKPLEIGGFSGTSADSKLAEPPGTFVVKYVVIIGNRGHLSVQLTKVLPVKLGPTGRETMVTNAFLPTTNIYGEHHPFHPVTIAPGQFLNVGIRVTVRCFPLLPGNSQPISDQSFVFKVFGVSETQTLSFANVYPVTIVGPQDCKSKG